MRYRRLGERPLEFDANRLTSVLQPATDVGGVVPIGGIIMWSGSVASIPSTWHLCDGTGGTPDLQDRFIVGAGSTYDPGDTGGEDTSDLSHTHDVGTLATQDDSHTHGPGSYAISSEGHTHGPGTLATDAEATHTHDFSDTSDGPSTPNVLVNTGAASYVANGEHTHDISGTTDAGTSHSHTVDSGITASDSHSHTITGFSAQKTHNHTVTGVTATGGLANHDNRPQYYAICFIMRIS